MLETNFIASKILQTECVIYYEIRKSEKRDKKGYIPARNLSESKEAQQFMKQKSLIVSLGCESDFEGSVVPNRWYGYDIQ